MKVDLSKLNAFHSKIQNYKKLLNHAESLHNTEYWYIAVSADDSIYSYFVEQDGEDNVLEIKGLDKHDQNSINFIKYDAYSEFYTPHSHSDIRLIYYNLDLSNLKDDDIFKSINRVEYKIEETVNLQRQISKDVIKRCHFIKCRFNNISSVPFLSDPHGQNVKANFIGCLFNEILFMSSDSLELEERIVNSYIISFFQGDQNLDEFNISGENHIEYLVTSATKINLNNISINLYYHKLLDYASISTDNVKVNFDSKILKPFTKDNYEYFLNTFTYLHDLKSMVNNRIEIEKYINYFNSRKNPIKFLLFWFNMGHTRILRPLIFLLSFVLINFFLLYDVLNITSDAMVYIFYPIDLFKQVVLKDFSFGNDPSWAKIIITISEILFIYSSVSLGIAIKKLLGFKINA